MSPNSKTLLAAVLLAGITAAGSGVASERVDHYERKPSPTLEAAMRNFADYNKLLSDLLARKELSGTDLEAVHELTYTLEVALAKMNAESAKLAETLEALHKASEAHDIAATRKHGGAYLETAGTLVPWTK